MKPLLRPGEFAHFLRFSGAAVESKRGPLVTTMSNRLLADNELK
jgi:hypothetical protein